MELYRKALGTLAIVIFVFSTVESIFEMVPGLGSRVPWFTLVVISAIYLHQAQEHTNNDRTMDKLLKAVEITPQISNRLDEIVTLMSPKSSVAYLNSTEDFFRRASELISAANSEILITFLDPHPPGKNVTPARRSFNESIHNVLKSHPNLHMHRIVSVSSQEKARYVLRLVEEYKDYANYQMSVLFSESNEMYLTTYYEHLIVDARHAILWRANLEINPQFTELEGEIVTKILRGSFESLRHQAKLVLGQGQTFLLDELRDRENRGEHLRSAARREELVRKVGVVDGLWVDAVCDEIGDIQMGSLIIIRGSFDGRFDVEGWSYDWPIMQKMYEANPSLQTLKWSGRFDGEGFIARYFDGFHYGYRGSEQEPGVGTGYYTFQSNGQDLFFKGAFVHGESDRYRRVRGKKISGLTEAKNEEQVLTADNIRRLKDYLDNLSAGLGRSGTPAK